MTLTQVGDDDHHLDRQPPRGQSGMPPQHPGGGFVQGSMDPDEIDDSSEDLLSGSDDEAIAIGADFLSGKILK